MDLRQLRYFIALAEELHFGRAAERLHISQPPLSQQIRALEEELDVQLFERTSRSVQITEAGRLFYQEVLVLTEQMDHAARVAQRAHRGELGELRIGIFPSAPIVAPVAKLISDFRQAYPSAKLALKERQTHMALEDLREGKLEISFLRYDSAPPLTDDFQVELLMRESLLAVFRFDHPLAASDEPIALSALRDERFVHFPSQRGNALFPQFMALCRDAGFEPEITQEVNGNNMILALVAAGIGISVLPAAVCRFSLPELRTRPIVKLQDLTGIWLAYSRRSRSPLLRSFIELYRRSLAGSDAASS